MLLTQESTLQSTTSVQTSCTSSTAVGQTTVACLAGMSVLVGVWGFISFTVAIAGTGPMGLITGWLSAITG